MNIQGLIDTFHNRKCCTRVLVRFVVQDKFIFLLLRSSQLTIIHNVKEKHNLLVRSKRKAFISNSFYSTSGENKQFVTLYMRISRA